MSNNPGSSQTNASNQGNTTGGSASSNDSDASMAQDASTIDGQMSGLTSDNASTDQSLNSQ
jgi:hypothetical protein